MYRILIISRNLSIFKELEQELTLNDCVVEFTQIEIFDHSLYHFNQYDFIFIHNEFSRKINDDIIKFVKKESSAPIYVFDLNPDVENKIHYFNQGAEGHIEIPFNAKVTASRVLAVLRFIKKVQKESLHVYEFKQITIDLERRIIQNARGKEKLTSMEAKIMEILIENKDRVVSKDQIINHVWSNHDSATDNALGIQISRLRKKLNCSTDVQSIETVWGLGYMFNFTLLKE